MHEPDGDHEAFALRAKRGGARYVARAPGDVDREYERLWEGAFAGGVRGASLRWRVAERLFETTSLAQRNAARLADRAGWRLKCASAIAVPLGADARADHVVVKSVHAELALEWVYERFRPTVLIVERNPLNTLASWLELGIGNDVAEARHLRSYAADQWGVPAPGANASKIEDRAFFLGVLIAALRDAATRHPEWHVASHETLCLDAVPRFRELFESVGLPWSRDAEQFLRASEREGRGYRTARVASETLERWRSRLDTDDVNLIRSVLDRFPFDLASAVVA